MAGEPGMPDREPDERVSSLQLATLPSAAGWARRFTATVLHSWLMWPETIETAELLISEIVTNSIKAAGPPPAGPLTYSDLDRIGRIVVTLRLLPGQVVMEVADNDPCPPLLKDVDSESESGRGLLLVQALSKDWGFEYSPSGDKVVFAVLGIPTMGEAND